MDFQQYNILPHIEKHLIHYFTVFWFKLMENQRLMSYSSAISENSEHFSCRAVLEDKM